MNAYTLLKRERERLRGLREVADREFAEALVELERQRLYIAELTREMDELLTDQGRLLVARRREGRESGAEPGETGAVAGGEEGVLAPESAPAISSGEASARADTRPE